jgi:hypothetical protein
MTNLYEYITAQDRFMLAYIEFNMEAKYNKPPQIRVSEMRDVWIPPYVRYELSEQNILCTLEKDTFP